MEETNEDFNLLMELIAEQQNVAAPMNNLQQQQTVYQSQQLHQQQQHQFQHNQLHPFFHASEAQQHQHQQVKINNFPQQPQQPNNTNQQNKQQRRQEIPHNQLPYLQKPKPYLKFVEQVSNEKFRFRYETESRSSLITGINSTKDKKTYPSVKIEGYKGDAVVLVSCVTENEPYQPHPLRLDDRNNFCKDGVCTLQVPADTMTVQLKVGVQSVRRSGDDKISILSSLEERQRNRVDPFRTGFEHKNNPKEINLHAFRLCFQAFISRPNSRDLKIPLEPIVSNPIYDSNKYPDLNINKLSHCSGTVAGGTQMIILCEKVDKKDISVRFYEERNGEITWQANAIFNHDDVHKQVAISFATPSYRTQNVDKEVIVYMQLRRPSDGAVSPPREFKYLHPSLDNPDAVKRKRRCDAHNNPKYLVEMAKLQRENNEKNAKSSKPLNHLLLSQLNARVKTEADGRQMPFQQNLLASLAGQSGNSNTPQMNINYFRRQSPLVKKEWSQT